MSKQNHIWLEVIGSFGEVLVLFCSNTHRQTNKQKWAKVWNRKKKKPHWRSQTQLYLRFTSISKCVSADWILHLLSLSRLITLFKEWESRGIGIEGSMLTYGGSSSCDICEMWNHSWAHHGARGLAPFTPEIPRFEVRETTKKSISLCLTIL